MHTLTTLQTQFLPTVGSSISDSECTLTPKSPGAVISHSSVTSPSIPVILNALIMAEGNMYLPQQRLHAQLDEEKARGVDSSSISKVTSINTSPSLMVETTTSSSIVSVKTSSFFIESADVNQDDDIIDDEKHAQEEHISLFSSTQSRPPPANIESAVLKHLVPDIINERDGPPSSCIIEEQEEEKHDDDKSQQSASTDSSDAGDEDSEYSSTGASQTLNAQISYPSTTQLSTLAHQSMLESIVHVTSNISVVNTISSAISQSSFLVGLGAHQVKAIGNG